MFSSSAESQYEGRLSGKGTLRKKSHVCTDDDSFKKAHYAVLQQSSLVDPYIEEHKKILVTIQVLGVKKIKILCCFKHLNHDFQSKGIFVILEKCKVLFTK